MSPLIFAALWAGNGARVATSDQAHPLARWLVEQLWQSGVPKEVLTLAPVNISPASLASGPLHFAAVDLRIGETRAVYQALGVIKEESGRRGLKILISLDGGLRPEGPGFLRQIARPRMVAIRALRHGADLKLF